MNDLIDQMSYTDCFIQINALLFSYGCDEKEVPVLYEPKEEIIKKYLKAFIKIGPKKKIMVDGVMCDMVQE